jgi:hypothetical protein
VHDEGWKESKVAALWKMDGPEFDHDPQPDPPDGFRDPEHVRQLVKGLKSQRELHPNDSTAAVPAEAETILPSDKKAPRQVFLGDGDAKNWTVHKLHFPHFTAITDFVHPVSYVYQAAGAVTNSFAAQWEQYDAWLVALWQGRVADVIAELETWSARRGPPPKDAPDDDPRQIVAGTRTYLANNAARMNYPAYRQRGLPITSCLVESLIKEFNHRVKGTEKFWNRPQGAEAILQVRAALLSDGDPLSRFILTRPGQPHYRRASPTSPNRQLKKI